LGLSGGNYRGRFFTATLRHKAPNGIQYALTVAPWRFDDKVFSQADYRTTAIQLTISGKL
jgi:hypothetical protein